MTIDQHRDPAALAEPLKFAYWVPNVSGGLVVSKIEQRTDWGYDYNVELARLAENNGFEYALSQVRYIASYGAAKHADVYLTWGEPPAAVAEKIAWIRRLAAEQGRGPDHRPIRFGIRMHTITRDTSAEAWAEADRLLAQISPDAIARVQQGLSLSESEGQRRMVALHGGSTESLEIHPNVWAGVGLVRGGAGTALVGSHEEVADRIEEYAALGIEEFVLSAYPHLEGAYWFGEGVLPILEQRGVWKNPAPARHYNAAVPFQAAGKVAVS